MDLYIVKLPNFTMCRPITTMKLNIQCLEKFNITPIRFSYQNVDGVLRGVVGSSDALAATIKIQNEK